MEQSKYGKYFTYVNTGIGLTTYPLAYSATCCEKVATALVLSARASLEHGSEECQVLYYPQASNRVSVSIRYNA